MVLVAPLGEGGGAGAKRRGVARGRYAPHGVIFGRIARPARWAGFRTHGGKRGCSNPFGAALPQGEGTHAQAGGEGGGEKTHGTPLGGSGGDK